MPEQYPLNSTVLVHVTKKIPSGLLGKIGETRAIIRNREIAWGEPSPLEQYIGNTYPAKVLGTDPLYQDVELSLRLAERDPWNSVPERFPVGTDVDGRVIGLTDNAAFVEIEEAVEGYLRVRDLLPDWERIGDLLWVNDHIQATVTALEPAHRRLVLSVRERVERRAQGSRKKRWQHALPVTSSQAPLGSFLPSQIRRQMLEIGSPPAAALPDRHRTLIVEADREFGSGLKSFLQLNGCESSWVPDTDEALVKTREQDPPFDLILIGWGLEGKNGHELVELLQAQGCRSHLVVFLEPVAMALRSDILDGLRTSGVDLLSKSDEAACRQGIVSILRKLEGPACGANVKLPESAPLPQAKVPRAESLVSTIVGGALTPAKKRARGLERALDRVQRLTQASTVALMRYEVGPGCFEVEACAGRPFFSFEIPADLVFSPIGEVLVKGSEICEQVAPNSPRFARLLKTSPFRSFLGIPLPTLEPYHYGLIVFKDRGEFRSRERAETRAEAHLIGGILQEHHFVKSLQPWQSQSLMGQMLGSVVHEVTNKLRGIDFQSDFLAGKITELARDPKRAEDFSFVSDLDDAVQAIRQAQQEADRLRQRYLGLTGEEVVRLVDMNQLAEEMLGLLRTEARHNNITLVHQLSDTTACIRAHPGKLRQVLINLILNAIQQMAQWNRHGKITVQVTVMAAPASLVQVRCIDEGPGIHAQLWERVFDFGFTSKRGGAGVGLTVSRQIAAALGGSLKVESSDMFWGTTFLLELPQGE